MLQEAGHHAHGAELVAQEFAVKNVVTNGLVKKPGTDNFYSGGRQQQKLEEWARTHAKLETISVEDIARGGRTSPVIDPIACSGQDPKIAVLWGAQPAKPDGWSNEAFGDANNHSVGLRIDFGKASFLSTGDLEVDAVPSLVALHAGSNALDVDVWQVSHHGSANGTNDELLDALTPEIALMGTGDPNRTDSSFSAFAFGHPRKTVIDELLEHLTRKRSEVEVPVADGMREFEDTKIDEAIYATGWDGTVVVTAHADGTFEVTTEK